MNGIESTGRRELQMLDKTMVDPRALIYGFGVDAEGGVTELDWEGLRTLDISKPGNWYWIHLNR